jgi:hypothetical protein
MKIRKYLIVLGLKALLGFVIFIIHSAELKAQGQVGFNAGSNLALQDTVLTLNGTVKFYYSLKNAGNIPLQGTVEIFMQVLDSTGNVFSSGVESTLTQLTLAAGDTTQFDSISISVSPQKFSAGGGIVVIWPSKPGYETIDTFKQAVQVSFPINRFPEAEASGLISAYPNPASDFICLPVAAEAVYLCYSMQGAYMGILYSDFQGCVEIPAWPAGQYLLRSELEATSYRILLK